MLRTGTIGDPEAPVRQRNPVTKHLYQFQGHYVDCRSYEGFSGSPCFLIWEYALTDMVATPSEVTGVPEAQWKYQDRRPVNMAYYALLAGIFTGHYDEPIEGEKESPVSRLGVGIVLPINFIREALMTEAAKQERAELDEQRRATLPNPEATTASVTSDGDEFSRFQNLTRNLVQTPKPDRER